MAEKKQSRRGSRPPSAPAMRLKRLLVANVEALLERDYPIARYRVKSAQQQRFAKDAGISWSSMQRLLDPDKGQTLDVLADVAVAFHVKAHQLLDPELLEVLKLTPTPGSGAEDDFQRRSGG